MEYNQFLEEVKQCVTQKAGKQHQVQINHVIKNNEVELDGLVIFKKGDNLSPNIYLNSYYKQNQDGRSMNQIVDEIMRVYDDAKKEKGVEEYEYQCSYEELKPNIIYRIVNYQKNVKILADLPHVRFLDLAITFHCLIRQDEDSIGTIRVTRELMNQWKKTVKDLLKVASKNTPELFPIRIRTMDEVLREILMKDMEDLFEKYELGEEALLPNTSRSREEMIDSVLLELDGNKKIPMYIMTNTQGINGATTLLYQDAIGQFANEVHSDFYVLPSSIHEVILVPYQDSMSKAQLQEMVCDVNQTQVPIDEILSDQVYIYRRNNKTFEL